MNIGIDMGKGLAQEDFAHATGDPGRMILGVRSDIAAALATTNGDYIPFIMDSTGHLHTAVGSLIPGVGPTSLGKAEDAAHANGDTGVAIWAVRQDVELALAGTDGDYIPFTTDATGRLYVNTKPFAPIGGFGLVELIGVDDGVANNEYSGTADLALGSAQSGEILNALLYTTQEDSGAILTPKGVLFFLNADPATVAGDSALTATERKTVVAQIPVTTTDWESDTNGASAELTVALAFGTTSNLYAVWLQQTNPGFNSAGNDDEVLEIRACYRRDS